MNISNNDDHSVEHRAVARQNESAQRIAYLDRALWDKLAAADSTADAVEYWLVLQCRMIEGVARAAVFLHADDGGLAAAAFWPERAGDGPTSLLNTAKRALDESKGVISGHQTAVAQFGQMCSAAHPFVIDGEVYGVISIEILDRDEEALRSVMRQLQWGAAWIELSRRRQQHLDSRHVLSNTATALDLIALVVEQDSYRSACKAIVTQLSTRLECDLVALSTNRARQQKIVALSHSAQFEGQMNLMRAMAAAMEEASDQGSVVMVPVAADAEYRVTLAHEELARQLQDASIVSIPLLNAKKNVGAIVFQWPHGKVITQDTIDLCDVVTATLGPVLEHIRSNDRNVLFKVGDALVGQCRRLFGSHYLGRKLAFSVLVLLVAFFAFAEDIYRISAPAKIEGSVQRVSVAPFDGYIAAQAVRAGDTVRKGMLLASLDKRELTLEHLRWLTTRQQRVAEYDQAMAKHDRAGINIIEAQIQQADAHIALFEEQLKRADLVAAFDGLVVSGDLSQSIGAAVKRGDELFRIAPLDSYRVILEVDESQVAEIQPGQLGRLKVASLLDTTLLYTVEQITPITESRDGRNFFRVEGVLNSASQALRPGMQGVAKTEAGTRLLIRIWTDEFYHWLRLKLWAWWP